MLWYGDGAVAMVGGESGRSGREVGGAFSDGAGNVGRGEGGIAAGCVCRIHERCGGDGRKALVGRVQEQFTSCDMRSGWAAGCGGPKSVFGHCCCWGSGGGGGGGANW